MGTGIGIYCVRCGKQLDYEDLPFDEHKKLCGTCVRERRKQKYDRLHDSSGEEK